MSLKPRDEIYVTLPSNVPGTASNRNIPADYETLLPTPLELNGEWEVALLECHYFHDWANLSTTELGFLINNEPAQSDQPMAEEPHEQVDGTFDVIDGYMDPRAAENIDDDDDDDGVTIGSVDSDGKEALPIPLAIQADQEAKPAEGSQQSEQPKPKEKSEGSSSSGQTELQKKFAELSAFTRAASKLQKTDADLYGKLGALISVPTSFYASVKELCEYITKQFDEKFLTISPPLRLKYDIENGRVRFVCESTKLTMIANTPYLFARLGLPVTKIVQDGVALHTVFHYTRGTSRAYLDDLHSIFVYSDIIDYQIVGNSKATLLGVFPTKGSHVEQQSWQFNPLQYISVPKATIQTIQIRLCNPKGELVRFLSGETLCRLHFRRKLL